MSAWLPFGLETELEARICSDPEWVEGARWGRLRPGHPEGRVAEHIAEVLANIDRAHLPSADRQKLRLVALIHDAFKFKVDESKPRVGRNHHATIAGEFASRYIDDPAILEIIELHDEAYNSWSMGKRTGRWDRAQQRAIALVERLGPLLDLYLAFYEADSRTGSKDLEPMRWFRELVRGRSSGGTS